MFHEYEEIESLSKSWKHYGSAEVLAEVRHRSKNYQIHSFSIGSPDPSAPSLIFSGGVHGLEKIGTQVTLSFMRHLEARISWDRMLQNALSEMRITFIPLVNPVGMHRFSRSNGNGVDLMRNAPIEAKHATFAVGGHHLSRHFPWFRGNPEQTVSGMEVEARALLDRVERETRHSCCTLALDLHSGFGTRDQLWFPYATSLEPFADLPRVKRINQLLDQVMPNHVYLFEPQAKHYTTHGDLWDYALKQHQGEGHFIPLTLEMGSWNWVKKNPFQLFSLLGPFNPVKPHRMKRAMRRHLPLLDFLMQITASHSVWSQDYK